jgi:tetratricopeptide (TPR) repeat protein
MVFAKMCARLLSRPVMSSVKYLVVASLLLSACAHTPQAIVAAPAQTERAVSPDDDAELPAEPAGQQVKEPLADPLLPKQELTSELLYEYLIAEIGNQRGYKLLAVNGSADLAKKTRDPRLAKRAAQLAFESNDMEKSLSAFKLWQAVEPNAPLPPRMLVSIFLRGGKLEQAKAECLSLLKKDEPNVAPTLLQIGQMLGSYPDKPAALAMMRELSAAYPNVAEAYFAQAQLARVAGDMSQALVAAKQARNLRPDWDMAVSLEAEILQKTAPQQGLQVLNDYLAKFPEAHDLRLQYARALVEQQQFPAAREAFQRVADNTPPNPDLAFAIAMISLQMNDLQGAEIQLKDALAKGKKDQDTVHYYLGQLSEAKKQNDEAIGHYRAVQAGEHLFAASVRVAYLLSVQGKLDEARSYLHQQPIANNQQRAQLLMVEAQLLRDAKQYDQAHQVLRQGLEKLPNHPALLYEAAMMADKIGKFELAEQDLRKLMQLNPQDANAYNALGFSLLERNERVPEAVLLVEKALQLAPDDIAIMDSVGWGYYRTGKLDESVQMLRRAFAGNPDPEIASHLGEVLWAHGDKDEAMQLLQASLKAHPGNQQLLVVIKKITP